MEILKNIFQFSEDSPMIFTSLSFWIFLIVIYSIYSTIYNLKSIRNVYLLVASLFFYYKTGGYFFILLCFTTLFDYFSGLLIAHSNKKFHKKIFLFLSLFTNLFVLSYFKYSYFIIENINILFNSNLQVINLLSDWTNSIANTNFDINKIILPIGISFYTFQSMSYTIDVYRNKLKPVRNIFEYSFFVTFFPQLVAGPIVRASEFIPQISKKFELSNEKFNYSILLIISGLIKKIVISDYISINFVDRIFDSPLSFTGFENLVAIYAYAIQIYCDFSGYTDIAIGIASIFGFTLPLNFNSPYKSINITEFWKRWHISLSTWFRDYLFLPIAYFFNRKFKNEKMFGLRIDTWIYSFSIIITWFLVGLWHGANIKFIYWGLLHGIALIVHRLWMIYFRKKKYKTSITKFLSLFLTFHFICFAWIFFRSSSSDNAYMMLIQIFNNFGTNALFDIIFAYKTVFLIIAVAYIIHWIPNVLKNKFKKLFIQSHFVFKLITIVLVAVLLFQSKSNLLQPFIYFQF